MPPMARVRSVRKGLRDHRAPRARKVSRGRKGRKVHRVLLEPVYRW